MEKVLSAHELLKVYCSFLGTKQSILQRQGDAEVSSSVDSHQREIS